MKVWFVFMQLFSELWLRTASVPVWCYSVSFGTCTLILESFEWLIFTHLIFVVICYSRFEEVVNIPCNKNPLKFNFLLLIFAVFLNHKLLTSLKISTITVLYTIGWTLAHPHVNVHWLDISTSSRLESLFRTGVCCDVDIRVCECRPTGNFVQWIYKLILGNITQAQKWSVLTSIVD